MDLFLKVWIANLYLFELREFCRVFLVLFGVLSHLWSSERPLPDPPFTAQRPSAHPVLLPVWPTDGVRLVLLVSTPAPMAGGRTDCTTFVLLHVLGENGTRQKDRQLEFPGLDGQWLQGRMAFRLHLGYRVWRHRSRQHGVPSRPISIHGTNLRQPVFGTVLSIGRFMWAVVRVEHAMGGA